MRLLILFMVTGLMHVSANTFSQTVTLRGKSMPLAKIFTEIRKQTGIGVYGFQSMFEGTRPVTVNAHNKPVSEFIQAILANQPLEAEFKDNVIIIRRKESPVLLPTVLLPKSGVEATVTQQRQVSGRVVDGQGTPLVGVTVSILGTTTSVTTDEQGDYRIGVTGEQIVLVFTNVGFEREERPVLAEDRIDLVMRASISGLDEVVVTGYTGQSKRSITGSVETITSDELAKSPAASVENQLQGKISGVNITASGNPAGGAQVRIRGLSNFGNRNPLYIIDGAPANGGMNDINPADIETLSVLKDASSASIYGARAANGVVLITTKKGGKGQPAKLTYNSFFTIDADPGKLEVLNAKQWGEMEWLGQRAAVRGTAGEASFVPSHPVYGNGPEPIIPEYINGDPSLPYDANTNRLMRSADTDWYDAVTRVAFGQNHNLGILGGGENNRYGVSFGYLNRQGTLIANSFQRYSTRLNTEFSFFNNRLRVGENITIAYSENNGVAGVGDGRQRYHPLIPVWDEGGNFGGTLNGILGLQTNAINPVATQRRRENAIARRLRTFGNAYVEADILTDLTFRSSVAIDFAQNNNTDFVPENVEGGNPGNSLNENSSFATSLIWTNTLNYDKKFGNHRMGLLAGTEAIELKGRNISFVGTGFFSENPDFVSISTSTSTTSITGSDGGRRLASLFGKLDYAYNERYLINATVRRDGSSALGLNNRFDVFPAIGLGWIISDERFLANNSFLNLLKLRAGWGAVGNQNSLGDFSFISSYAQDPNFTATGYDINAANGGNPANGIALLSRGNPDLVWESAEILNVGMDFGILNDKFSGSIEWYDRRTKDLLLQPPAPLAGGSASPAFVNLGEIRNTGIDASLSYHGRINDLTLGVTGLVSTYANKVLDIDGNPATFYQGPGGNPNIIASRTMVGHEIGAFYGLVADGVIQDGPNAGNFNFRDVNNDGTIGFEDQQIIGSPHADFTYSLNLVANYKDFDFTAFFRGSQGNEIWAYSRLFTDFQFRDGVNRSTRVLDAWRPDNPSNTLAEFNMNTANYNMQASSYYVEDGSYLRLQTVQLGYTFSNIGLIGIKNLRVYLQGQNVFTVTKYSGIDPEINENGGLELGVDRGNTYTVPRTFLLGINVSL